MTNVERMVAGALATFSDMEERCVGCGACTTRCDLLEKRQWNVGALCGASRRALEGVAEESGLQQTIEGHEDLYRFARSCEACDRCTVHCPQSLSMSDAWRPWRGLVRAAGRITDFDVGLVKVDRTWHTFSAFRAINGVGYDDLPLLQVAPMDEAESGTATCPPSHSETLFFPGCTLVSYVPELTRAVHGWLTENVSPTLLADQCCAWPLECAGEMERAKAWRERVVAAARAQGVKRIVTVCPGCERQLALASARIAPETEYVSLAQLLVEAGVRAEPAMLEGVDLPVSVVDSCNDRAGAHGLYVRTLFENVDARLFPCTGQDAWCCGAGGNVAAFDEGLSRSRTQRSFRLCDQVGARTLVAACPTCAYTYAFERWLGAQEGQTGSDASLPLPGSINYLEIVFGIRIDWSAVFGALTDMWQGEHGAWVAERLSQAW